MQIKRLFRSYEVAPPAFKHSVTVGQAAKAMHINGCDDKPYHACFCCRRKFADDETPYVSYVFGYGSRFFCEQCAEKVNEEATVYRGVPIAFREAAENA